ncbi:MAG TPA: hypothetical protein VL357_01755 [Rariglobus sp.]|nr:hypothetical protein [Rariglobus sp.]
MTAAILTLSGLQHTQIDLVPAAVEVRNNLLAEAAGIVSIADPMDADATAAVLRDIVAQLKDCENARELIGRPVLDITRKINATAKDFSAGLEAEKTRLGRLLGIYQQAERDKVAKAQREAEAEARRIAEEETKKIQSAEIEHGADSHQVEVATNAAVDRIAEARVAVASVAPAQPSGTAVRKTWKFEVLDIKALHAAHPELVVLSPNTAAINAVIKQNQNLPGLRIWQDIQASVR